ncbi:MAG: hybrid sensor histidine kinase/response regulator [Isosphaeraceae bacterium]
MVDGIAGKETAAIDRQRIELLLDGVRDYAIFLLDAEGRVLSWNDGATLLFGYNAAEVIGQRLSRFSTPEDDQSGQSEEELRQTATKGQVSSEAWQVRRDGTRFWACAVTTALRDERGELKGFAKVIRDATDRKQLEMELRRQAQELADANRRKDEFLAMLSHELRNPLAPVLNSVHVLRQAPHDPSLVQYAGNMVERQVRHMARLIDDLLDVTRLTHGKVRLRPERVDLAVLVERSAESVRPLMKDRGHQFHLTIHQRPIWLDADPIRVDQVLVNLLNNAAEFTDPGGRVELEVASEGSLAVIRVRDDGTGIAPGLLPHIFELFTQADTSLDRGGAGLGIGLTLVQRLVTLHGGTIQVRSEGLGLGSEFTVRLPTVSETARAAGQTGRAARSPARLHVLVVDDNVDMAMSLSVIFRIHGHAVEVAHDGAAALEAIEARPFEVVLLDIGLPTIDGYEVARRIRQRGDAVRPMLVGISGYGFETDREKAREAGFDVYLVKPVAPNVLEDLLERRSAGSPPVQGGDRP